VYDQDIPETEYEVIIVDDGSTDNTPSIMNNYIKNKKNAVILTQENKCSGGARNTGLRYAKGEFVWFVDSDDYIERRCFNEIYNVLKTSNADIMQFNGKSVDNNGIHNIHFIGSGLTKKIVPGKEILAKRKFQVQPWSALFNRSFLEQNNLFFKEKIYYEDNEWSIRVYFYAKKVLCSENFYYYYNNISTASYTKKKSPTHVLNALEIAEYLIDFCGLINPEEKSHYSCCRQAVVLFNASLMNLSVLNDPATKKLFIAKIHPMKKRLIAAMVSSKHIKYYIEAFLLFWSENLLASVYKFLHKISIK
jgi:glycosyltransferase involved in cell wall biosynthesis